MDVRASPAGREERREEEETTEVELRHTSPPGPGRSAKHCALIGSSGRPPGFPFAVPSQRKRRGTSFFVDGRVQTLLARIAARSGFAGVRRVDSGSMQRSPPQARRGRVAWWASIGTPARRDRGRGGGAGTHGPGGSTAGRVDRTILDEDDEGSLSMSTTLAQ